MADEQVTATNNDAASSALNVNLGKIPSIFKKEQEAGERAVESKIKAESTKAAAEAGAKAKVLGESAAAERAKYEEVKGQMKPTPEFKPTQENALDLGAIFSMIATVGVSLGGSGKLSSLNALNAMSGMMQGYQQGRKDLFAKEQAKFDKELQSIKTHNDALLKDLEQYQKLFAVDREAAMAKQAEIVAKNPGVIAELVKAGRDQVAYDVAQGQRKAIVDTLNKATRTGLSGKGTAVGQIQFRYNNVVTNSVDQLGIEVGNMQSFGVAQLPPELGNAITNSAKGIPTGIETYIAQRVTADEARLFQQSAAGVKNALTNVEASGLPRGATLAAQSEYGKMEVKGGDSVLSKAMYFALIKQVANLGVRDLQTSGGTPEQIARAQKAAEDINKIVPYSVKDVIETAKQSRTLTEDEKFRLAGQVQSMNNYLSTLRQASANAQPQTAAPAGAETGTDERGSYHWEYSPDGTQKRKVYD